MALDAVRKNALCLLGLAFLCAMFRPPYLGSLLYADSASIHGLRLFYDLLVIALGALLMAAPAIRSTDRLFSRRLMPWLSLASVPGIAILNIAQRADASMPLMAAGVALVAVGFAALVCAWAYRLESVAREHVVPLLMAAFFVSHVLGLMDLLPRQVEAAAVAIYPLFSSIILLVGDGGAQAPLPSAEQADASATAGYFNRLRALALCLVFVEIICGAILRSGYARGGVAYAANFQTVPVYIASALIGLGALVITSRSKSTSESALVVGFASLVLMVFATVMFPNASMSILRPVITGAYSMLLVLMMGLVLLWHQDGTLASPSCAGLFLVLYSLAMIVSFSLLPRLMAIDGRADQGQLFAIALAAGLVVALGVGACLFFMVFIQRKAFLQALERAGMGDQQRELAEATVQQVAAPDADALHAAAVRELAEEHGLTKREEEIARLIARGYTAKRIAEELVVSMSTVQSHSKSIYRKLGIHRKDELIEMVDAFKGLQR